MAGLIANAAQLCGTFWTGLPFYRTVFLEPCNADTVSTTHCFLILVLHALYFIKPLQTILLSLFCTTNLHRTQDSPDGSFSRDSCHYWSPVSCNIGFQNMATALSFQQGSSSVWLQARKRYPNRDPFLGFDFFRILDRETKRGKRPKVFVDLHRKYGETFEFKALSVSRRLSTCSPKNIQTIATTNFEDWGVEPFRGDFPQPFIGQGVFTHDGEIWKRAREIIRPTFNRAEIADLESFEVHVGRLLALIPRDGRIVDLQPLFKRLVS
jgi:hypothetical protein